MTKTMASEFRGRIGQVGIWGHMIGDNGENDECGHKTCQDLSEPGPQNRSCSWSPILFVGRHRHAELKYHDTFSRMRGQVNEIV